MLVYLGLGPPPAWLVFRKRVSWRVGKMCLDGALLPAPLALCEADRKKNLVTRGSVLPPGCGASRAPAVSEADREIICARSMTSRPRGCVHHASPMSHDDYFRWKGPLPRVGKKRNHSFSWMHGLLPRNTTVSASACKASRASASTPICARGTYVKRGHQE